MADTLYEWMKKKGFGNIQEAVNIGPNGTIDKERFDMIYRYMMNVEGWHEIDPNSDAEMTMLEPGGRIRYITNDKCPLPGKFERENDRYDKPYSSSSSNKFRTGGYLIKYNQLGEIDVDRPYLLYKAHVKSIGPQSIQLEHISRLFFLPKDAAGTKCRKPVKFNIPGDPTNYPVCLRNNIDNDTVTVYYAKDSDRQRRFMNTEKFKRAIKYGWSFKE